MAILQEDLARMRPLLDEAVKESVSTMEQIAQDTVSSFNVGNKCVVIQRYVCNFLVWKTFIISC